MKNLEEDILKQFLQDTFSDYEPEPSDLTWEHIRKEVQPQQPNVGAGLRQWIVPVVVLLLLIAGITWNKNNLENKTELAIISSKEYLNIEPQVIDYQDIKFNKLLKIGRNNTEEISEKTFVNEATSKVESKVLFEVERSFEVPAFSTISTKPISTQNVQEYAVSPKEFVEIEDKTVVASTVVSVRTDSSPVVVKVFTNNGISSEIVSEKIDNNANIKKRKFTQTNQNFQAVTQTEEVNENRDENIINHNQLNDAIIQEIRHIKPVEMLKNKDFVLVKNELMLPQISKININREAKPIRRPLFVSMSFTPLQTYRILTVNSQNVQNLQTNNLFDAERNGFAFDLGITKSVGNKWNLRGNVSYLKMRQWAEYQVNTAVISVKNSNNYSNAVSVGNNDNEFIGQTRIEAKTLQMVGFKADVQRFFKVTGRNRYFISAGSQLMIEPSEKQTNVFINASAGFQHLVNKDCFFTIEPTASYLLNNINDSKSLIQTNAYNLGLKVGVSFRVK